MLFLVVADALATPVEVGPFQPFYATAEPRDRGVDRPEGAALRRALAQSLRAHGLRLVLEGPDRDRREIGAHAAELHPDAAAMAWLALALDRPGAEYDWIASRAAGQVHLVSVSWDERELVVAEAHHPDLSREGPDAEALAAKWSLGPLVGVDHRFEPTTLGLLDQVFGALSPAELALVEDLPIHREGVAPRGPGAAAVYRRGRQAAVVVFDGAMDAEDRFAGEVGDPYHLSVRTLTHEVGHALSDAPGRVGWRLVASLERLAAADAVTGEASLPESRAVLQARQARAQAAADAVIAWSRRPSPVVAAWTKEVAAREPAPTVYGRSSPPEGFAEAFSLSRVDPRALRRAAPIAAAWFEAERHVAVARAAIDEVEALAASILAGDPPGD